MTLSVLTAVSAAALALALAVAIGLLAQSRRLRRLRDELVARESDVARMRSELDTARRGRGPVEVVDVVRPDVPRPRAATSPTAWRRSRAGGTVTRPRRIRTG